MERESLLKLYDRLVGLVQKLPGGLQKPILNEMVPIRDLFLDMRPSRIVLLGSPGPPARAFIEWLAGGETPTPGDWDNGWRSYMVRGRGTLQVLDAREEAAGAGLARFAPDAVLWLQDERPVPAEGIDAAADLLGGLDRSVPLAAWASGEGDPEKLAAAALASRREFSARGPRVFGVSDREELAETLCGAMPTQARLEFARVSRARRAQAQIARSLLKSFTAVCGVIGVQPIPLADLPILTSLQTLMVALIIHTTGRKASPRLVAEFLGALGFNIGAGLLFREGARALVRIFPIWGNAVSGMVAGAGTYAIGRAAIAYFVEEIPAEETRKLFRKLRPDRRTFGATPPPLPPPDRP